MEEYRKPDLGFSPGNSTQKVDAGVWGRVEKLRWGGGDGAERP